MRVRMKERLMSTWWTPTKLEPPLIEEVLAAVGLSTAAAGEDSFGCDYRIIAIVAGGRAEAEEGAADWRTDDPWLARACGHGGVEVKRCGAGEEPAFLSKARTGHAGV
ncbi:hypothetical protein [Streptomyces sp. NPDC047972]|uniref:hypothetical protein n=1 Tax=Streptomyces sp. NPDC047972 TaxID=3365493 RepID=UPI00371406C9